MNKTFALILLKIVLSGFLLSLFSVPVFSEHKTALVIGNGNYEYFSRLPNPRAEAKSMKTALESIGFDVIVLLDGTYDQMYDAIIDFESKLTKYGGIGLFHYGGHGVQMDGQNFLLPIDKYIPDDRRLTTRAVNVAEIVGSMEASGTETNIIILDACRDNPLPSSTRSAARGLSKIDAPVNSIVVYAAEAGKTAQDGLFTPILIKYIQQKGLEITDMMKRIRSEVREATGGKQRPGEYSMLERDVYLAGYALVGKEGQMDIAVKQNFGSLNIEVVTEGVLYIDGFLQQTLGSGTTVQIPQMTVGPHDIEMRYESGKSERQSIIIGKDESVTILFSHKPDPLPTYDPARDNPKTVDGGSRKKISPLLNLALPGITHIRENGPVGWAYLAPAIAGAGTFAFCEIYFLIERDMMNLKPDAEGINFSYDTMKRLRAFSIGSLSVWALSAIISTIHGAITQ
jgi:hypothetical protein